MITLKSTFQLDGQNPSEYQKILDYFTFHEHEKHGYTLIKEPLVNRVTAVKIDQVDKL